jgi:hypothetical protein
MGTVNDLPCRSCGNLTPLYPLCFACSFQDTVSRFDDLPEGTKTDYRRAKVKRLRRQKGA